MKRKVKGVIERFYYREGDDQELMFQLIKQNGTYCIKRGSDTLATTSKEEKAKKGFKSLRDKWSERSV